ncbi:Kinesin light chain 1 [Colletotrichum chlorophyti]|uniref:Kinesin light chain 1 n=1 Tax=Colletotrichum chlorophyti TaxID=708187 RepID=A0A1Q8RB35_9PEZI|nr:Kinesin light chain 1 [Colletotrichum chlorophyti]
MEGGRGARKEAEELQLRVIEINKRVLGEEHPDTLMSMHNLACTWKAQARWEDAIGLLQGCLRHREDVLGMAHPDTMSSASALASWKLEFEATGNEFS